MRILDVSRLLLGLLGGTLLVLPMHIRGDTLNQRATNVVGPYTVMALSRPDSVRVYQVVAAPQPQHSHYMPVRLVIGYADQPGFPVLVPPSVITGTKAQDLAEYLLDVAYEPARTNLCLMDPSHVLEIFGSGFVAEALVDRHCPVVLIVTNGWGRKIAAPDLCTYLDVPSPADS